MYSVAKVFSQKNLLENHKEYQIILEWIAHIELYFTIIIDIIGWEIIQRKTKF